MVFMRKQMVESPFQTVLRCFENVLRTNVPTSGLKEPDVGTFLHNTCDVRTRKDVINTVMNNVVEGRLG